MHAHNMYTYTYMYIIAVKSLRPMPHLDRLLTHMHMFKKKNACLDAEFKRNLRVVLISSFPHVIPSCACAFNSKGFMIVNVLI